MRAARGYESPTAILNPGQLRILELSCFTRPNPTGTGVTETAVLAIPTGCST